MLIKYGPFLYQLHIFGTVPTQILCQHWQCKAYNIIILLLVCLRCIAACIFMRCTFLFVCKQTRTRRAFLDFIHNFNFTFFITGFGIYLYFLADSLTCIFKIYSKFMQFTPLTHKTITLNFTTENELHKCIVGHYDPHLSFLVQ